MDRYHLSLLLIAGLWSSDLTAQVIKGVVTTDEDVILPGAQLWIAGREEQAVYSNDFGDFIIPWPRGVEACTLYTRHVGYRPDTLMLEQAGYYHIRLEVLDISDPVLVAGRREGQFISGQNPIKTEVISAIELTKAACCDLAGCFNTNASVQSVTSNIITQAKELRILGLGGVYNQVLEDGFPMFYAASYTYGMGTLPGPMVENIYISKGANSVLQGWDGISGQINVEMKTPRESPRLFANAYLNSFGEHQYNAFATQKGERWNNLFGVHVVQPAGRIDRDEDTFLDVTRLKRFRIHDRIHYRHEDDKGISASASASWLWEERLGGQYDFRERDAGSDQIYGQLIRYQQPSVWMRAAYRWDKNRRVVVLLNGQSHDQDSWFGLMHFRAKQQLAQSVIQFEHRNERGDDFKAGVSYRYFHLDENLDFRHNPLGLPHGGDYLREDHIVGAFAERISYFLDNRLTWIAGMRVDRHQHFGVQWTPRTLLKYDPLEGTSLRASTGMGWRLANVFTENVLILASNRAVFIEPDLSPERALNWGINITQRIPIGDWLGRVGADYYQTHFSNQIFPDFDRSPTQVLLENFTGEAISRAFQLDFDLSNSQGWELKAAYNYLDVYRVIEGRKQVLPFNPTHRLLGVLSYIPVKRPWQVDVHVNWYGEQVLPDTRLSPEPFQRELSSDPFYLVNAQFTWRFSDWDVYGGCENIFDFRQLRPIISWEDPFSPYFDTSSVWGPTRGREWYVGLRWRKW